MDEKGQAHLFDDVRVEPAAFRVWKAGAVVPLEPKAFEVLLFLIRNRGRVVKKRELLDAIWRDTFVGENALTREIAQVRRALGEDARRSRFIETVPTRGYRFIAEVRESVATANGRGGEAGAYDADAASDAPARHFFPRPGVRPRHRRAPTEEEAGRFTRRPRGPCTSELCRRRSRVAELARRACGRGDRGRAAAHTGDDLHGTRHLPRHLAGRRIRGLQLEPRR